MHTVKKNLLLFDIDGTLTLPRQTIKQPMIDALNKAAKYFDIAIVGGSDRVKQIEQLQESVKLFDFAFSENGTYSFDKSGAVFHRTSIANHFGESKLKEIINFCLRYIADLDIPIKRGTFIEYRNGLINISPIGRNCTQAERDSFHQYDLQEKILPKFAEAIREKFTKDGVYISIGGQISMDLFPSGWDKTYCLQFVTDKYEDIHFFGDKTYQGGNDFEIYSHKRVIGHDVKEGPHLTIQKIDELIKKYKYEE
jgi:phosphomannomutase